MQLLLVVLQSAGAAYRAAAATPAVSREVFTRAMTVWDNDKQLPGQNISHICPLASHHARLLLLV